MLDFEKKNIKRENELQKKLMQANISEEEYKQLLEEGLHKNEVKRLLDKGLTKEDLKHVAKYNEETHKGVVILDYLSDIISTIVAFFT